MIIDRLVVCVARDCLGQPVFALGQKSGVWVMYFSGQDGSGWVKKF